VTGVPLRSLAERAFKWSALTTAGRFALQLVAQIVLARLLGPDNYGVYGIGMVVLTFTTFLSGNAFSYILMLRQSIDDEDVRFAFSWQVMAGAVCALAMYFAAAPAITCLLQRELNFRALGLVQLASYGAGYLLVGVPMALAGWGPQALAAACVVQALVALVASYAVRPHPVRPLLRHPLGAETLDTGRTVFQTNLTNWLLANLDRIVMGRVLNTQAVGLYNVAYNIASIPHTLLVTAMQPTLLATGARMQDDRSQLSQAWLMVLACIAVLLAPASIVMALLAGDLVQVLYGPAWSDAGWVMAVMFLCVPAWAALNLSTPVLWNTGRKHLEVRLQLPLFLLAVPAWWLLAPQGIRAVAVTSAIVITVRAAVIVAASLRALALSPAVLLPFAARGAALSAVCGLAVQLGRHGAASMQHPIVTLLAGGALGVLVVLALVAVRPQLLGPEARAVVARLVPAIGPRWPAPAQEAHP
jgi:lipopolysaccharide exporter